MWSNCDWTSVCGYSISSDNTGFVCVYQRLVYWAHINWPRFNPSPLKPICQSSSNPNGRTTNRQTALGHLATWALLFVGPRGVFFFFCTSMLSFSRWRSCMWEYKFTWRISSKWTLLLRATGVKVAQVRNKNKEHQVLRAQSLNIPAPSLGDHL